MKFIKRFQAEGVYGDGRLNLTFNDELSLLYGLNGSGKTTALRLIMGLLQPDLEPLVKIPFRLLELEGESKRGDTVVVTAEKSDGGVLLLRCSSAPDAELRLLTEGLERELLRDLLPRDLAEDPVYQALNDISAPMFLGIDRRFTAPESRETRKRAARREMEFGRRAAREGLDLDEGLDAASAVIDDFMGTMRAGQFTVEQKFRKEILLDAFTFVDARDSATSSPPTEAMLKELKEKRAAVMTALAGLQVPADEFAARSDEFFQLIEGLIETINELSTGAEDYSEELNEALTAWFINQSQLNRLSRLADIASKYQEDRNKVSRRLDDFVGLINEFFEETGKKVVVIRSGNVRISQGKRFAPLRAMSSGERQIFIMLAHLTLNPALRTDGVFIVDEPELSLHVAWQDKFVDAVRSANPRIQLILATHSPTIIGGRREHCIPVLLEREGVDE